MNIQQIEKELRKQFPHGHKDFIPMLLKQMELHSAKNYKYAHGGPALGNFERVAAIMKLYPNIDWAQPICVALLFSLKQFDAATWMLNSRHEASSIEGIDACLGDDMVYKGLARIMRK